jgi:NADPH:quinone reductase-like Zn-dependent oxidoreductase
MASGNQYGAYQTHSICPAWTTFPLAENTSYEDAATLPLAVMTAAIGLFVKLGLAEPTADGAASPEAKGKGVLVWAASSSVGAFAVQLAKKAGY